MLEGKKIGVIGGGKMGGALIAGMIAKGLVASFAVVVADTDKSRLDELAGAYGVAVAADNDEAVRGADLLLLSVKPQSMADVLAGIKAAVSPATLVVSIAAGISTGFIEERLGAAVRVIRVMPNMPALIGEGAAALCRGASATTEDMRLALALFAAVGIAVEVAEGLMDAVTGLSGSGPGYAFLIIEALADAGVRMGLARDVALKLAAQTFLGAAKLCLKGDHHPAALRDMVTSPGGTTLAGLKALEDGRLRATLMAAVEAATRRSAELGEKK
jgi:pyrroline-5-carboxylate reductase